MFTVVVFKRKKSLRYTVAAFEKNRRGRIYYLVTAPYPIGNRRQKKLLRVLLPFLPNLLLPVNCPESIAAQLPQYPSARFETQVLLHALLKYCKCYRPPLVSVLHDPYISPQYYKMLSEFVGQLNIIGAEPDIALCNELLAYSGTSVLFLPKANLTQQGQVFLCLNEKADGFCRTMPLADTPCFSPVLFERLRFLPDCNVQYGDFEMLDPLQLTAAMWECWKDTAGLDRLADQLAEFVPAPR